MSADLYSYRIVPGTWRCVDGDTIDLDIDLGFRITTRIRGRLLGVDTPERGEETYDIATERLKSLMTAAQLNGSMIVRTKKCGKWGRWLVELPEGINQIMAESWPYPKPCD